jgi:Ca2+/Na+ antiporter
MSTHLIYSENVSSKRTLFLFIALALLFLLLFTWRVMAGSKDFLAIILLFCFVIFLFYSINYRTLVIRLTSEALKLSFGIFTWTIPINNVSDIQPDDNLPVLVKYGGAGIHFTYLRKRYRASFNFLEHSRVVIGLKNKAGLVRDISFSTCQPNEIIRLIQGIIPANKTA